VITSNGCAVWHTRCDAAQPDGLVTVTAEGEQFAPDVLADLADLADLEMLHV
jgi:hypothetical protein